MASLHRICCFVAGLSWCLHSSFGHAEPPQVSQNASVSIVGVIDQGTTLQVLTVLSKLPRRLDVTIDSPGGHTPAAEMIVNAFTSIRTAGTVVKCRVTGKALSAAFWILQSCSIRESVPSARLMAHEPYAMWVGETGTYYRASLPALRDLVKGLEHDSDALANTCATRMHIAITDWHKRLEPGDWNMTATEALKQHALDSIIPPLTS